MMKLFVFTWILIGLALVSMWIIFFKIKRRLQWSTAMYASIQEALTALTATVAAETAADKSAIALINGIPALIAQQVAAAQAAGATPAQLQGFTDLGNQLAGSAADLAAAVTANTPAAPATGGGDAANTTVQT